MNKFITSLLTIACAALPFAPEANAATGDSISYIPKVHGTLRGRFEVATRHGDYRFQLRNARVSLAGNIAPAIDYFLQADFCDRGSIKFLDGWVRMKITDGVAIQAGQFRMPFGVDPFRGPHTYFFANRSFLGNQVCNYRAVGGKISYAVPSIPLTVEAGVFNPGKIGDHTPWNSSLAYAAKATYTIHNVKMSAGMMSISPDSVRSNIIDGCLSWSAGRWIVEGEYMYKHYTHSRHVPAHAYNIFADYHMPIKAGFFNRLSFQGRFDGMTSHSSCRRGDSGHLMTDHPRRNRITVGTTISYIRTKNMFLDLRVNYEKYFYSSHATVNPDSDDKAVVELVLRF